MDNELIKKCIDGDREAFNQLILAYQSKVYALSLNMMKNESDAEDVAQEAFVKIYKSLHRFKFQSSLSTWIYRITSNTALDFLRKRKNTDSKIVSMFRQNDSGDEVQIDMVDTAFSVEEIAEKNIVRQEVLNSMSTLSERHRNLIILRFINGLSYDEIASIVGIPIGSVKSGLARAKEEIKKVLKDKMEHF